MLQSFCPRKFQTLLIDTFQLTIFIFLFKTFYFACDKDYFYCKSSFICLNPVQRCDGIVDCCSGNITDQSDELDCDIVFEVKPPQLLETLEGRTLTITTKLAASYPLTEYMLIWYRDSELLGQDFALNPPFEAYPSESTKTIIFNWNNPDTKLYENFDMIIMVNDRKRNLEGVCHKRSITKAVSHVNVTIRKRPSLPEIGLTSRTPELGKSITLSCNVLEGYVRPQIKWLKGTVGNMTEFPTTMLVDITNPHNVMSRMVINTPQQYQGVVLGCKSAFEFLNESMSDLSPLYKLWPPKINYTSAEGDLIISSGSSLNLSCLATGFPPPLYAWHFRPYRYAKERILKQSYYNLPAVQIEHSGYYQCQVYSELGEDSSAIIQIIVPDPSLGFLAAYFSTKVSFISFLIGILALIVVIGLIMFFVYRKVSDILERRNKLMLEEAAALAIRAAGKQRKHNKMATDQNSPPGAKRLKAPPAILDSEKPFVSAMDQEPIFPKEDIDEILHHEDADGPPQIPDIVLPAGKMGGDGKGGPVIITEFQYPDDDDNMMMLLLKK